MQLLDGKYLSKIIKAEIAEEVSELKNQGKKIPNLAAILVGENPASAAYVKSKIKSCEQVGFKSTMIKREATITEEELLEIVDQLNNDDDIDGFIVQLPLPGHIDELKVTMAINPDKDVDGFHPLNFGKLAQGLPCFIPATPLGIILMLERYNIPTAGKKCVVVGRSNIVGTPMSILMSRKGKVGDCTVTLAHSRTKDIGKECLEADILIAAIGKPHFIKADMVKEGAVVIDVGINRIEDESSPTGTKIVGDVDFDNVAPKCSFITPVPGGVGLMTVTCLLLNTLKAAKLK
ncbi:MAG: bifunctional methylenetetrahydrofolate dehydrogenase/methenyltetrahydrofolate cyclohydrolase FolD [Saprospiraceae bacterium]|nr:bifunctional methylenetetrahydrofolate dehydrogenase/methenyltetrahydrofolate cyclohydrolase FolD [Saprospiraceae bacterium]